MIHSVEYDPLELQSSCDALGVLLVVAFGSRAGGSPPPTEQSDLDLAVLDSEPFTWDRFSDVYRALQRVFRTVEADVAFLNHADPLFRFEIFRTAERLYGSEEVYFAQKSYAFKAYADSADLRRLERRLFERRMEYIRREIA